MMFKELIRSMKMICHQTEKAVKWEKWKTKKVRRGRGRRRKKRGRGGRRRKKNRNSGIEKNNWKYEFRRGTPYGLVFPSKKDVWSWNKDRHINQYTGNNDLEINSVAKILAYTELVCECS